MGILDEDVAAVRAASDIVGVVSQYLQLRRVGRRWVGLCPFHPERTPSFSVNAEENLFYCFGCQAKGDVITFVREVEHLDFVGAVEWLAARCGVSLRYTERAQSEGRKQRARLVDVMSRAVDWYHQRLLSGADAGPARRYLRQRGLDGDIVREYRVGWAPDGWDELCRALGLGENDARATGLGFRNSRNRLQDSFRARVMFPIFDAQGDPVSFGGRILPGTETPRNQGKYKNTPETGLYHKSKVLYGLDRAKAAIVATDTAVVCEGYTDVIGFHRSGVTSAVATCGTALTDDHVQLLRRYARRLVLAFDADGAGQAAAERFYQWEREHDLEVAVADLPVGQDPADLALDDPARLTAAIDGATPFLRFRLDRVFAAADLSSPEGRARAAERALAIVAEHPVELVRDQYLMDVAGRCRLDPERLRPQLDRVRSEQRRGGSSAPGSRRGGRAAAGGRTAGAGPDGPWGRRARSGSGGRGPAGGAGAPRGTGSWPDGEGSSGGEPAGWPEDDVPHPADWPLGDDPGAGQGRLATGPRGRVGPSGPPRSSGRSGPSGASGPPPGGAAGGHAAAGRSGGSPAPVNGPGEGPALEVLRHVVHDPDGIRPWLREEMFHDPRHRATLRRLAEAGSPAAVVSGDGSETDDPAADDPVADLVGRLVMEEPSSEPFDAVRRLLSEVARARVGELRLTAGNVEDPAAVLAELALLNRSIGDLAPGQRDTERSVAAAKRLLAWLAHGSETGDD